MRPPRGLLTIVWKEVRALLPVWAGWALTALLMLTLPEDRRQASAWWIAGWMVASLAPYVFVLAPIALGALSMGHEFTHRTWPTLLSQPMTRARLLALRMSVLATLIATAGMPSMLALSRMNKRWSENLAALSPIEVAFQPEIAIPLLGGLLVAPWFALVARNAIGGMVAAFAAPGLVYTVGQILARIVFGHEWDRNPAVASSSLALTDAVWRWGMAGVAIIAASGLGRSFCRAEVTERRSPSINDWRLTSSTGWSRTARRASSPVALLVAKELRLHVPTLAVAAVFVLVWGVTLAFPGRPAELFAVYQVLFGLLIALLAGAVASAEERQFGTIDSQSLLPMAAWRQWAIKVAVVVGVVVVLSVGVNVLLVLLSPGDVRAHLRSGDYDWVPMALGGFMVAALYASSIVSGGLRALILGGFGIVTMVILVQLGGNVLQWFAVDVLAFRPRRVIRPSGAMWNQLITIQMVIAFLTAFAAIRFAYLNHQFADFGPRRIVRQVGAIYVWVVGSLAVAQILVDRAWR